MLLIITNSFDATVDFVVPALQAKGIDYWRLDTDRYPHDAALVVDPDRAQLAFGDSLIDFSRVSVTWWRRPIPPTIDGRDEPVAAWAAEESRLALDGAWRTVSKARWINHPDHNRRAQDKLGQLRAARKLGFDVPDWLVTNDLGAAREFVRRHEGAVVAKPLGDGAIDEDVAFWTSLVSEADLRLLGPEPYLLQRLVTRQSDLRVVVVGEEVFAVSIDASRHPEARVDWRRAGAAADHEIADLDSATREKCLHLCRSYGLAFAAIDLAVEGGEIRFFEINPNGQWAWLEQKTGVPISAALARLFMAK